VVVLCRGWVLLCFIKMVKEILNSYAVLRYLQLFEDNEKFIEMG